MDNHNEKQNAAEEGQSAAVVQNKPLFPLGAKVGGISFSATALINLAAGLVASIILVIFSITDKEAVSYISLLTSPIAIAVVLTLALKVAKQPAKALLPVKTHPKYYLMAALIVFGTLFSLGWINEYVIKFFQLFGYVPRDDGWIPDVAGWKVVPAMLVVAVIPAAMEEILFRGILLNNAETEVGSWRAVLISGFCFSLYHSSVEQTVYQFILGCLLALLAVRSRSVLPSMLMHFLNNGIIILLMACGAYDKTTDALIISQTGSIILTVLSAVSLVGGVLWLILDKTQLKKCVKGGVRSFFIWASAGIALTGLMWIIGLFIK